MTAVEGNVSFYQVNPVIKSDFLCPHQFFLNLPPVYIYIFCVSRHGMYSKKMYTVIVKSSISVFAFLGTGCTAKKVHDDNEEL